jgi:hypothetical protein
MWSIARLSANDTNTGIESLPSDIYLPTKTEKNDGKNWLSSKIPFKF